MTEDNELQTEPTVDDELNAEEAPEEPSGNGRDAEEAPTVSSSDDEDYSQYDDAPNDDGFAGGAGLVKMLITLGVLGGILGGVVFMAYQKSVKHDEAIELITEAVERLNKDGSYGSMVKVREALQASLVAMPEHPIAVSKLALLEAQTYLHDGEAEAKTRAQAMLSIAEANDFPKAERYAARALLDLADGNTDKAFADLKQIFDKGAKASDLFYVFGLAQVLKGNEGAGGEQIKKAATSQVNNVWLATAAADAEYRSGRVIGAFKIIDQLLRGSGAKRRLRYAAQKSYFGLMFGRNPGKAHYREVSPKLTKLEKAFKRLGGQLSPVGKAVVAMTHAESHYRAGDLEKATAKIKEVEKNLKGINTPLTVQSERSKLAVLKGRIALVSGDLAGADKAFRTAINKTATNHSYHAGIAVKAAIQHRQWDLADQMLLLYETAKYRRDGKKLTGKAAKEARADDYDRFLWKIRIALGRGEDSNDKTAKARYADEIMNKKDGLLELALSSNTPGNAKRVLKTVIGDAKLLAGDIKGAKSHYETWLSAEPKMMATPVVAEALGRLAIQLKNWGEAEAAMGKALNLYKGKGYDVYTERRIFRRMAVMSKARGKRADAQRFQALADGKKP